MNLLYLTYWGINDPLTVSTVLPNLEFIAGLPQVHKVVLMTIERSGVNVETKEFTGLNIIHRPLYSNSTKGMLLTKFNDYTKFPGDISAIIDQEKIDLMLARTASAGSIAYLVHNKVKTPFIVESFEPHADYMLESKEWRKSGIRYQLQRIWEKKQIKFAERLITVSDNFKSKLIETGVDIEKVHTIPCTVNCDQFSYNSEVRSSIRNKLNISKDATTGIYVGKFGGIYYDKEAFQIFKESFDYFGEEFRMIILTPNDRDEVESKLVEVGINLDAVHIGFTNHNEIPDYLSASDMAFSTIKPAVSREFCSPVKNGEYWASGLPILMTDGVGDDYLIINNEHAGALFNLTSRESVRKGLKVIAQILSNVDHRKRIAAIGKKYRNFDIAVKVYSELFEVISKKLQTSQPTNKLTIE